VREAEQRARTRRAHIPDSLKIKIWQADHGRCRNCGGRSNLHIDHVIPVSEGGATSFQNLQILCQACNLEKGARIVVDRRAAERSDGSSASFAELQSAAEGQTVRWWMFGGDARITPTSTMRSSRRRRGSASSSSGFR